MTFYHAFAFALGFLDLFAISMIAPHTADNSKRKGYSPFMYGLAGTAYGVLQTFSSPAYGGFSDIHGRKVGILLAFGLSGLVYLWLGFIDDVVFFVIARAMLGTVKHTQTMTKAYICDITPKDEHAATLGRFYAISSAGFIVGPLVGAHIGSFEQNCVLAAGIFFASGLGSYLVLPDTPPASRVATESRHRVAAETRNETPSPESVVALFRSVDWTRYWDLFCGRLLLATAVGLYRANLNFLLMSMYSLTTRQIGYVTSLMGCVAAASGFLVAPTFAFANRDSCCVLVACGCVLSASLFLLYSATNMSLVVVLLLVFQLSASLARSFGLEAVLNRSSGSSGVGLLHGAMQSVSSVSRGIIPLLGGVLQGVSAGLPALASATLAFAGSLIFVYSRTRQVARLKRD